MWNMCDHTAQSVSFRRNRCQTSLYEDISLSSDPELCFLITRPPYTHFFTLPCKCPARSLVRVLIVLVLCLDKPSDPLSKACLSHQSINVCPRTLEAFGKFQSILLFLLTPSWLRLVQPPTVECDSCWCNYCCFRGLLYRSSSSSAAVVPMQTFAIGHQWCLSSLCCFQAVFLAMANV